jgi:hypothetical protein
VYIRPSLTLPAPLTGNVLLPLVEWSASSLDASLLLRQTLLAWLSFTLNSATYEDMAIARTIFSSRDFVPFFFALLDSFLSGSLTGRTQASDAWSDSFASETRARTLSQLHVQRQFRASPSASIDLSFTRERSKSFDQAQLKRSSSAVPSTMPISMSRQPSQESAKSAAPSQPSAAPSIATIHEAGSTADSCFQCRPHIDTASILGVACVSFASLFCAYSIASTVNSDDVSGTLDSIITYRDAAVTRPFCWARRCPL